MGQSTASACLALVCSLMGQTVWAEQTLVVEPNHTTIGFSIPIAGGLTKVTGKFTEFQIVLEYEGQELLDNIQSWSLEARIASASIDTGIEQRDKHLRSEDFFGVETFPEITFISEHIEQRGDGYIAVGEFSMHGVSRQFELPFSITGQIGNQGTNQLMTAAVARTTLLRSDYGIARDFKHTHITGFLGDEVEIEIHCWLQPPKKETETSTD